MDPSVPSAVSDAALLGQIREGDERAFEALVLRYRVPLARYVTRVSRRPVDADDVLQTVFLRLWMGRDRLSVSVSMRAYLYAAARHQTLNLLRDTRAGDAIEAMDAAEEVADAEGRPDAAVELADLEQTVRAAIDALPARCREVFLLSREGELSYPEIAEALGISVNTVKTQMSRALSALAAAAAPFLAVLLAIR